MRFLECVFDSIEVISKVLAVVFCVIALMLGTIAILVMAVRFSMWWLLAFLLHPVWGGVLIYADRYW